MVHRACRSSSGRPKKWRSLRRLKRGGCGTGEYIGGTTGITGGKTILKKQYIHLKYNN